MESSITKSMKYMCANRKMLNLKEFSLLFDKHETETCFTQTVL